MKKHLKFYKQCMNYKYGVSQFSDLPTMPSVGLCNCGYFGNINNSLLHLFEPNNEDRVDLKMSDMSAIYWASGKKKRQ